MPINDLEKVGTIQTTVVGTITERFDPDEQWIDESIQLRCRGAKAQTAAGAVTDVRLCRQAPFQQ